MDIGVAGPTALASAEAADAVWGSGTGGRQTLQEKRDFEGRDKTKIIYSR